MFSLRSSFIVLLLIGLCLTVPAHAYVDLAPTLAKVIADSKKIAVVEVVEFNREKHVVVLKEIRLLKGESSAEPIQHDVTAAEGAAIPRQILQWAAPGARGVLFVSRNAALVCVGHGWYQVRTSGAPGTPGAPVRRVAGRGSSARTARTCPWPITDPCPGWPIALR